MAKRTVNPVTLDFAFFTYLWQFYTENRGRIRQHYRDLTKHFLDFNDSSNAKSFLRQPQFEALEMYIFLKEFLDNALVHEIFQAWVDRSGKFQNRGNAAMRAGQISLLDQLTETQYTPIFERMQANARTYSNYIFALTMGTGKTILMATCIFYEFLLANKFPKDEKYCHNALVFAPDKTVLQSLREMQTFDMSKVVPPEYINFLSTHIQFHFLDEAGIALSVLDKSRFNLIVSNTQKIILKRQSKEKTAADQLFGSGKPTYDAGSIYAQNEDLYAFGEPEDEDALTTNQRFEKLRRLEQLGIYVDEAHHAFGTTLAKDMGVGAQTDTSLRRTIDELAKSLEKSGTHVVACYNYTGTPYVGNEVLPEVVYAFGLQEAIDKQFLKLVYIHTYTHTKTNDFVQNVIKDFVEQGFYDQRHEGMLPKLAFFASTIDELQKELRPAVEKALLKHNIPTTNILVNTGDEKITTNDDIREFNRLDTVGSTKQFILLVNKGREGWNCRSLFGVALFREPKSKIFVLQATMRCLRSIGDAQQTGQVYLSDDNRAILDEELKQNFRLTVDDLNQSSKTKNIYHIQVVPPPVTLKLKRIRRQFNMQDKTPASGFSLGLDKADTEKYRLIHTVEEKLGPGAKHLIKTEDLTASREHRTFSRITLVAEISRYLNKPCLFIQDILDSTSEGTEKILIAINEFNELLYDVVVPHLFKALYDISSHQTHEEYEVELVKIPDDGYYSISASPQLVVTQKEAGKDANKSFHLDTYCFDSAPERNLFWKLIQDGRVDKLYFTGMLTHGQSDFYVQYIDPDSHTVRSYYPDFLFQKQDGSYVIVEVKGDNKIEDPVVLAKKDFAEQMAVASGMTYKIIRGTDAANGIYDFLLTNAPMPHQSALS